MGLNNYNDDNSPMIEYKFGFIGEQTHTYERQNAYESDYLYVAKVQLLNPITKEIEIRDIKKWGSPVTHADVVEYINNIIKIKEQSDEHDRKQKRKETLLHEYKEHRYAMPFGDLYELIDLLQDTSLR